MKINSTAISDYASVMGASIIRECNKLIGYQIHQRKSIETIADLCDVPKKVLESMRMNDECPTFLEVKRILHRNLYELAIYDDTTYYGTNINSRLWNMSGYKIPKKTNPYKRIGEGSLTQPFLYYCEYAASIGLRIGIIRRACALSMASSRIYDKVHQIDADEKTGIECTWTSRLIEFVSDNGTVDEPIMGCGHGRFARFNVTGKVTYKELEDKGLFLYDVAICDDGTMVCKLPEDKLVTSRYYVITVDSAPLIPPTSLNYGIRKIVLR